jgi:hypothetical protein
MREIKRVPDVALEPMEGAIIYGVKSLPVTFSTARSSSAAA